MTGFMGLGMAQGAGGANAADLFAMSAQQKQNKARQTPVQVPAAPQSQASADSWTCVCGAANTGKFCAECGEKQPEKAADWKCGCGAVNTGKFCSDCGKVKPAGILQYKCAKCGWEPEDKTKPPKFCPECGNPF
jgi:membrane protease subunit (stomatin/prohibitin family)